MDDDEFEVEPQQRQVAGEMQTEGSQITEQVTTASQEAAAEEQLRNPSKVLLLTVNIVVCVHDEFWRHQHGRKGLASLMLLITEYGGSWRGR
jgi:hypothetical protein